MRRLSMLKTASVEKRNELHEGGDYWRSYCLDVTTGDGGLWRGSRVNIRRNRAVWRLNTASKTRRRVTTFLATGNAWVDIPHRGLPGIGPEPGQSRSQAGGNHRRVFRLVKLLSGTIRAGGSAFGDLLPAGRQGVIGDPGS